MGKRQCRIEVQPDGGSTLVAEGTSLLDALIVLGIELNTVCGGSGICGRCIVQIVSGPVPEQRGASAHITREQQEAGYVLACQTPVQGNLEISIPSSSRLDEGQVLKTSQAWLEGEVSSPVERVDLELEEPTLVDNRSDLTRVQAGLAAGGLDEVRVSLPAVERLPAALREHSFRVDALVAQAGWLVELLPKTKRQRLVGAAIDIGTTTVVVELLDLQTGELLWLAGDYNPQGRYGADVISRIVYANENDEGGQNLQNAIVNKLNELFKKGLQQLQLSREQLVAVVVAGNTTMIHLLLGLPSNQIRLEPYIPVATAPPAVSAGELGLFAHAEAAVHCLPGVASYMGGDITSGLIAVELDRAEELTLFLDIGTNGEMVLGNSDWLLSCACSAGPAFEGVGLESGMRAVRGAIDSVVWSKNRGWQYRTIGNKPPRGICGSGLIDLIAALWRSGVVDRAGRMQEDADPERVGEGKSGIEFVLVPAEETVDGRQIVITQGDVRNLLRSKAAVFAGLQVMLSHVGMDPEQIERVLVAGGFGNYLDIDQAVTIGLLPDLPRDRFIFVGNSSLAGARKYLLSSDSRRRTVEVASALTYLELSIGNEFMDEFTKALFLPHTDLEHFPTVGLQKG